MFPLYSDFTNFLDAISFWFAFISHLSCAALISFFCRIMVLQIISSLASYIVVMHQISSILCNSTAYQPILYLGVSLLKKTFSRYNILSHYNHYPHCYQYIFIYKVCQFQNKISTLVKNSKLKKLCTIATLPLIRVRKMSL